MLAADTNVVVRFLTHDDPRQTRRAVALFRSQEVWLAKTVLLETEWVLRNLYGFSASAVAGALRALGGMPNVHVESPGEVAEALDWANRGLDFADALHLASSQSTQEFVSFDERFVKRARRAGIERVTLL